MTQTQQEELQRQFFEDSLLYGDSWEKDFKYLSLLKPWNEWEVVRPALTYYKGGKDVKKRAEQLFNLK